MKHRIYFALAICLLAVPLSVAAQVQTPPRLTTVTEERYRLQPGDVLEELLTPDASRLVEAKPCVLRQGGIGFTVSLFVSELAFGVTGPLENQAKLGILAASVVAAVLGSTILVLTARNRARRSGPGSD